MNAYLRLMRFHRPLPILLLLWPTYWGLWLAAHGWPSFKLWLIFTIGVVVMRAAGCVINDLLDRHFDSLVARTHTRPLASGELNSRQALRCFVGLLMSALILVLFLNAFTFLLALIALVLTLIYPFMKRILPLPQGVLGLAFNFGLPMAFAATQNHIPAFAWLWFVFAIVWTIMYDTEYALCDEVDDRKLGLKSSAILLGRYRFKAIYLMQILLLIMMGYLFYRLNMQLVLVAGTLAISISLFLKQRQWLKQGYYLKAFNNNIWFGLVVWIAVVMAYC